jgi:hypothetical protein
MKGFLMTRRTPSHRGTAVAPTALSRLGAVFLVVMAAMIAGARATEASPERYSAVLLGAVIGGAVLVALGMWRANSFEARLAAVVLSALSVVGQLLAVTLGGPGSAHAHWYPAAFIVVALGCAVPVLIVLDARSRDRSDEGPHPYAL